MKACDRIKHKEMFLALKQMGARDKHIKWVEKSHSDFEVVLKIGREEISIKCRCGVRQGDNLDPASFFIFMQLVTEDILDELMKKKVELPKLKRSSTGNGV